ncbi:MAG: hypothetical protein JW822_03275 [Spirochaetales bacterium]|nr:hypothetical protein [Spirochaetales bacterium]
MYIKGGFTEGSCPQVNVQGTCFHANGGIYIIAGIFEDVTDYYYINVTYPDDPAAQAICEGWGGVYTAW